MSDRLDATPVDARLERIAALVRVPRALTPAEHAEFIRITVDCHSFRALRRELRTIHTPADTTQKGTS